MMMNSPLCPCLCHCKLLNEARVSGDTADYTYEIGNISKLKMKPGGFC